jgi:hypothetical protein
MPHTETHAWADDQQNYPQVYCPSPQNPTLTRRNDMAKPHHKITKLDDQLAKMDEQMAEIQEGMAAIKAKKAKVLTQKRQEEKRQHDRSMVLLGRVIEKELKSETAQEKRDALLVMIRSRVDNTFPKTREQDRLHILDYLDHLAKILEPLSKGTSDAESVMPSRPDPQATPVAASIPGQDGLAGANRGISGA